MERSSLLDRPPPDDTALDVDEEPSGAVISDEHERAAALREEAARFAAIACARALRAALQSNPDIIARFVDDALHACGRTGASRVRLHPDDAAAYGPARPIEVIADCELDRGELVVECAHGAVRASIEERAALLVRAVTHA